jgi:hypothetical protein
MVSTVTNAFAILVLAEILTSLARNWKERHATRQLAESTPNVERATMTSSVFVDQASREILSSAVTISTNVITTCVDKVPFASTP